MPTNIDRSLRLKIRAMRCALTTRQQQQAAAGLTHHLSRLTCFQNSKRIAFYLPNDGEIDPGHCQAIASAAGKACYLPLLHPLKINRLLFARFDKNTKLSRNRFGIPEPDLRQATIAPPWSLNIIVLPLVAFDANCHRIGMGGGFYDRTLAFMRHRPNGRPLLIGAAHASQQIDTIKPAPWDMPLDMVVTDEGVFQRPHINSTTNRN